MSSNESCRWRSPLLALLWKEWRQQRWVYLLLLIGMIVGFAALLPLFQDATIVVAVMGPAVIGIVTGANAFCGERDDDSTQFTASVPTSAGTVFWVKAGCVVVMVCVALFAVGCALHLARLFMDKAPEIPSLTLVGFVAVASAFCALGLLPAVVSVLARRTLPCVLFTGLVTIGLVAVTALVHDHEVLWAPRGLPIVMVSCFPVTLLLGRWLWCWSRVTRTLRARGLRFALFFVVLLGASATPWLVEYVYVTFFADVPWFLNAHDPSVAHASYATTSPDGRWLVYHCSSRVWVHAGGWRSAVFNVETGTWRWLTGLHGSLVPRGDYAWSPSGRFLEMYRSENWLWPFPVLNPGALFSSAEWQIVDPETGERRSLAAFHPSLARHSDSQAWDIRWLDGETCFLLRQPNGYFVNVANKAVRVCRLKGSQTGFWQSSPGWGDFTQRGVFFLVNPERVEPADTDGVCPVSLVRFAPDLREAEVLPLSLPHRISGLRHVSEDGRWGIVNSLSIETRTAEAYLCSLETGKLALIKVVLGPERAAPLPRDLTIAGFVPGSHVLLIHDKNTLSVFDPEKGQMTRAPIAIPVTRDAEICFVRPSPSGRFALLRTARDNLAPGAIIADLETGQTWELCEPTYHDFRWIDDEQLLSKRGWIINHDGTGNRSLLPKQ